MELVFASDDGQCARVAVSGRISQGDFGPYQEPLAQLLGPNAYARRIVLDLSNAEYLESSGVGWLLTCHKRMKEAGGNLTLLSPQPVVSNVLRVLRLGQVFEILDSLRSEVSPPAAAPGGKP
jgi:anti-sigma B factor antagonist